MASWTKKLSSDTRYSITLTINETSTSVANNTSVVSYTLTATKSSGSGYYTSNSNNQVKITINGKEVVNKKISYDFTGSTPKTITLASGTTDPIKHEDDGTKTIACSGYFKDSNNSLGNATASGNLTLTPLHKPPEVNIATPTEQNSVLTGYGITGSQFVAYLSIKSFFINTTRYDDATITSYTIKNGTTTATGSSSSLSLNFKNKPLEITNNLVYVQATATDSMGATGTYTRMFSSYVPYFPATIVASNFTTKRAGQLTGNITLKASGTYYNGSIGSGQTAVAVTPKVSYRYKEKTAQSYNDWIDIVDASVTKSNGNWSTSITLSGFNYQSAFDFQLKVTDNVAKANGLNVATASTTIPVGEPTWTEYKDRVDFKKLTIDKKQILAPYVLYDDGETSGNITLNDSSANYEYIDIYYTWEDTNKHTCSRTYSPNGKTIELQMQNDSGTYLYNELAFYGCNGTALNRTSASRWRFATSGNPTRTDTTSSNNPSIRIYRVVGYK